MGEKFAANQVMGTVSLTVPIFTSPGRSAFDPQLSLSYNSGTGNGPFGFGWSLSLPSITRKTDKGLPQYRDAEESDEFILSGAEDLVPVLMQDEQERWGLETLPPRTVDGKTYTIQRYRPRIEGLFARIERWTNQTDPGESFWRSISKDNITTWYGRTADSRIADPTDKTRIFSWLICETYDDKGNVVVYTYKAEDSTKVDLSQAHEKNRTKQSRSANRYLKRIRYGNHTPYFNVTALAKGIEAFCRRIRPTVEQLPFAQRRQLVELLIDRVIVTDSQVEIRYVVPTGPKGETTPFCQLRLDYFRLLCRAIG